MSKTTNRYVMNAEELVVRAAQKDLHARCREGMSTRLVFNHRAWLLAWAYIRQVPYRRVERICREGNKPDLYNLSAVLGQLGVLPVVVDFKVPSESRKALEAWLSDPSGAVEAPVRVKRTKEESLLAEYKKPHGLNSRAFDGIRADIAKRRADAAE